MKKIKAIIIILVVLLSISVVSLALNSLSNEWSGFSFNSKGSVNLKQNETIDATNISNVIVSSISEDITVTPSSDNTINIKYYGNDKADSLTISQEGTTLRIEKNTKNLFFFNFNFDFSFRSSRIEIALPIKDYDSMIISSTSGDIKTPAIKSQKIELSSISGKIEVDQLFSTSTKISTTSGDIQADSLEGNVTLKSISGKIEVNRVVGSLEGSTTSGDLKFSNFTMNSSSKLSSISGSIKVKMVDMKDSFSLETSSLSGKVTSAYPTNTSSSNLHLKLSTTSGRISIE